MKPVVSAPCCYPCKHALALLLSFFHFTDIWSPIQGWYWFIHCSCEWFKNLIALTIVFWFLLLTFDTATRVTDLKQSHEHNGSPLLPCCLSASSRLSLATRRRSSIRSEAPSMTEKAHVDGMKTMGGKVCSESKREWADYTAGQRLHQVLLSCDCH